MNRDPRIGLALGSGSARGWAHIGVIRALRDMDVRPDIVAGTSIGALVGAAAVVDQLDELESWVTALDRLDILKLLDASLTGGGFMSGGRLMRALSERVPDRQIQDLDVTYAAVATDFESGREVWLREGSLQEAVRASIALPGLFSPVPTEDGWLLDGGLVNPVPVSLCRALGADIVIAVNLNGDTLARNYGQRRSRREHAEDEGDDDPGLFKRLTSQLNAGIRLRLDRLISSSGREEREVGPGLFDVMTGAINIVQDRITRSRMAGDPPDIQVLPRLSHIRLMEFDRAGEAINEGSKAVERIESALQSLLAS